MTVLTKRTNRTRRAPSAYNPFNGFFDKDIMDLWDGNTETVPSVNIREEKEAFLVELAAPGLTKEDFNVEMNGNILTVSCDKESEKKEGGNAEHFSRREYNYASFSRSLTLPENADVRNVSAKYNQGVLTLGIPKKPVTKKTENRKIRVE